MYPEWKQELITFNQFLERIIQGNASSSAAAAASPTYLAQHPLFDQVCVLLHDYRVLTALCLLAKLEIANFPTSGF